jgi:toxin ParE1/3/4
MTAAPHPYLIFYEISDDEVIIVGIRHGARRPKSMPGGDG